MKIEKTAQNKEEAKADNGKPKLSLVPRQIIFDIAKVREFGTKKYGDSENWRHVDTRRYRDAAFRHFMAYLDDPYGVDEESGLSHLSHLACNIAFLCEMEHVNTKKYWGVDIIADAVRKYWATESKYPEPVIVYFYQKRDFDGDDEWISCAEYVRPFNSDDFYNMIFDHNFCAGLGDIKDIHIVSAEEVADCYQTTILGMEDII